MKTINKTFYGDSTRWFVGTVVSARDTQEVGRVRVRIDGIHSPNTGDVDTEDLPWAICLLPTTEGGTSGLGFPPNLKGGAKVFGMFLDGATSQIPIVLGSIPIIEYPSRAQIVANSNNPNREVDILDQVQTNTKQVNKKLAQFNAGSLSFANLPRITDPVPDTFSRDERRLQSIKFFLDNYNPDPAICAGIVGNLEAESGFDTQAKGDLNTSSTAIGIAQWRLDRKENLRNFASSAFNSPADPENFAVQLAFVVWELKNYPHVKKAASQLPNCDTYLGGPILNNSTYIFAKYYEKPANKYLTKAELARTRESYAAKAINDLLNNT